MYIKVYYEGDHIHYFLIDRNTRKPNCLQEFIEWYQRGRPITATIRLKKKVAENL